MGNGGSDVLVLGDAKQFEIVDIKTRSSLRLISVDGNYTVVSSCSVNNILALGWFGYGGNSHNMLQIYDVRTWELVNSKDCTMQPYSLDLTSDLKYVSLS